ncbi:MAG: hypothetical protein ABIS38_05985 [Sphingomicrobium sp.]
MRFLLATAMLLLSACATAPKPVVPAPITPTTSVHDTRGGLIGLNPSQLVSRLGNPALQVREGSSVKLQFRNTRCVLDAYLYPQTVNDLRVTHIDTRAPSGVDTNQTVCIATFERIN